MPLVRPRAAALVAALSAILAVATISAPAEARTLTSRAATYVDVAAPSANFAGAASLSVDGSPVRRALLRFSLPAGTRVSTLRLYATTPARQRVTIRTSDCAWKAATVTARNRPRTGRALATKAKITQGWNSFRLPAGALRAGSATCLQVTTAGRARIRFRAQGGAHSPRLDVTPAKAPPTTTTTPKTTKPTAPAPAVGGSTWTSSLPPSAAGYCTATSSAWTGTGRTITVIPGQSLQAAINAASPGDTVELADGTYSRVQATITKAIRLRAQHPFGAVLLGNATPRTANDTSVGTPTSTAIAVRGDGIAVEGLEIRYYDTAIAVDDATNTLVQGNRIVGSYGVGVQLWDTRNSEVRCNELLDPYLADDPTATLTSQSIGDAQMDYGVNSYGGVNPRIEHNYFFGIFNQALSFKEGNLGAYAGYNTFEGFNLTALFFGQNVPHNGPYSHTGLPVGPDRGTLVAEYNVFRAVYGMRGGAKVVYYARSPIRVWHVDATTILRGNVIESSEQGFLLECRAGASAGCASGTILLQDNVVGGRVRDLGGSLTTLNHTAGVLVFSGLPAAVTLTHNLFAMLPTAIGSSSDGVSGTPSVTQSGTTVTSSTGAPLPLRAARATTDPDLAYPASL
jgi:hypothetical protein